MIKASKYPNLSAEVTRSGLTQAELGKILNITPLTISHKMTGKSDWTLSEIEKLCDYYKKDFYELFKKID